MILTASSWPPRYSLKTPRASAFTNSSPASGPKPCNRLASIRANDTRPANRRSRTPAASAYCFGPGTARWCFDQDNARTAWARKRTQKERRRGETEQGAEGDMEQQRRQRSIAGGWGRQEEEESTHSKLASQGACKRTIEADGRCVVVHQRQPRPCNVRHAFKASERRRGHCGTSTKGRVKESTEGTHG